MSEEPTKEEIADTFNSIMCVAHQCKAIYGTPAETVSRVLNYWVESQKKHQRLHEWLDDYIQEKKTIGTALGLEGDNRMNHSAQIKEIYHLQNRNGIFPEPNRQSL